MTIKATKDPRIAFDNGVKAGRNGWMRSDCPYVSDRLRVEWLRGYDSTVIRDAEQFGLGYMKRRGAPHG